MQIFTKGYVETTASAEVIFQTILEERGYATQEAQDLFLHPPKPTLSRLLKATSIKESMLKKFKTLLNIHIEAGHDICVFGDYDADGITATAILWQALIYYTKGKNSRILPFLPDRHRHGYGLSVKAIEEMVSGPAFKTTKYPDFSPQLIITVDNGIVAHQAITVLRKRKIDVIITDHHEPTLTLPEANLIIHTIITSGAGIAWIVALYLLAENEFSQQLIDLAAIGIVADMMPLTGLNRGIVVHGLRQLSKTNRLGLLALYEEATIKKDRVITTYDINYIIAPRINAAGRLHDPYDALRLLCATKSELALPLAKKINAHNEERQLMTEKALQQATKEPSQHKIIVVVGDYHEGIIGLVAGKLTELFHKPAIVMSRKVEIYKASARSIPGVNITELLRSLKVPYLALGGHSAAAGFSLSLGNFNEFIEELYTFSDQVILEEFLEKKVVAELELTPTQVSLSLAKLLASMEPFGMGNSKPKFLFRNIAVLEDRELGKEGKHHKLLIKSGNKSLDVLLFNTKEKHPLNKIAQLIASIDINVWRSHETVQLIGNYVET